MKRHLSVAIGLGTAMALISGDSRGGEAPRKEPVPPAPVGAFQIRDIEGWVVYIEKKDLREHADEMARAIDDLRDQLYQIRLVVPAPAVAIMQERVPMWMAYDSAPGLSFHPDFEWLLARGYPSPEGLASLVSHCRAKGLRRVACHQPWVILHEMAHGYDYLYLGEGRHYSNARIKAVYERAKESGKYDSVLCRYAEGTRHYGMSNPMEYIAENTEAYFGANDFYPFVRAELREHDPACYRLLQDLWGVDAEAQDRLEASLAAYLDAPRRCAKARGKEDAGDPGAGWARRGIAGWTVRLHPAFVRKKAEGDAICRLLRYKLRLVGRHMPEKALERLREVPIRIEEGEALPYATYRAPKARGEGSDGEPRALGSIEIRDVARFVRWQGLQPFMILNLLARAYYERVLGGRVPEVEAAWREASRSGTFDAVLRFDGKRVRHPALKGPADFFAEMTESYYALNDHYPFLQFETRRIAPKTCELLAKLWGGEAR